MARWTGTWLQGPSVSLGELRDPSTWPGSRLGLPKEGPGAVATFGARGLAFLLDIVLSAMAAGVVTGLLSHPSPAQRQAAALAVLAAEQVLLVALTGQTLGMRLGSLKVMRLSDSTRLPGVLPSAVRGAVLVLSLGLAGFFTKDGRGLHDLLAGTVVVRS